MECRWTPNIPGEKMRENGKKKLTKLACGHTSDKLWLVTAPDALQPAFERLGPGARIGLQLVQCSECKLMLDIRLVLSPLEPKKIIQVPNLTLGRK
jgi:hypothetical protein